MENSMYCPKLETKCWQDGEGNIVVELGDVLLVYPYVPISQQEVKDDVTKTDR